MTPQAPRRSLPQSVSGPGSRAPPAASSSAGHRVRHLPGSPRTPIAVQSSASKDVAPVRPCAPGRREPCPQLPGSSARGAGADLRPEGRSQGARCRSGCGKVRAVRVRPGRAGQGGGPGLHPLLIFSRWTRAPRPPPPHRRTPRVKTSQSFNLHMFQRTPSISPSPPWSLGPQISTRSNWGLEMTGYSGRTLSRVQGCGPALPRAKAATAAA